MDVWMKAAEPHIERIQGDKLNYFDERFGFQTLKKTWPEYSKLIIGHFGGRLAHTSLQFVS